jgi:hypothetical protein
MLRIGSALAIAMASLLLVAAAPARMPKVWKAHFRVSVQGTETTNWTLHHRANPAKDACDIFDGKGGGSQTVKFHTVTALRVTVVGLGDGEPMFGPSERVARVTGTMNRYGKTVWTQLPGTTSDCGGEPLPPGGPDCGVKPLGFWWLALDYLRRNDVSLVEGEPTPYGPPEYKRCALYGPDRWGMLPSDERLPESLLSNRAHGKIIVVGNDEDSEHHADYNWYATLHWVLTLRRVK